MSQPQHIADRYSLSTALFGMMVLALGMGIGRFLYTPCCRCCWPRALHVFRTVVDSQRQLCGIRPAACCSPSGFSSARTFTPYAVEFSGGDQRTDPRDGAILRAGGGDAGTLSGRRRQRRDVDLWFHAGAATYPQSFCHCLAVFWRRRRNCAG